jgi:hypothetical protein
LLCVAIIGQWLDLLSAMPPTFAVRENGLFLVYSLQLAGFVFNLQLAAFKSVSPLASFFLLLRQKKETKEKTPDRSKARNKINHLRQRRNSRAASVSPLRHSAF